MGKDHTCNSKDTSGRLNFHDHNFRALVYSKSIGLYRVPCGYTLFDRQDLEIRLVFCI